MPRVAIKKQEYLLNDFEDYIRGQMKRMKITQSYLANQIHMEQSDFSRHLRMHDFKVWQLVIIFKELDTPQEKIGELLKL